MSNRPVPRNRNLRPIGGFIRPRILQLEFRREQRTTRKVSNSVDETGLLVKWRKVSSSVDEAGSLVKGRKVSSSVDEARALVKWRGRDGHRSSSNSSKHPRLVVEMSAARNEERAAAIR